MKLSDLIEALDNQFDESGTFYNKKTGETYFHTYGWDDDQDKIEEIEESDDWIALPSQFDINEYEIMEEFIDTLEDRRKQNRLAQAIQGRGAFRRFKDTVNDLSLAKKWYAYRDAAIEKIGRDWCKENNIPIEEDVPSSLNAIHQDNTVHKILVVIDMQNDFIDGSLGTKEAQAIVPHVINKIKSYPKENVYATRDTHPKNYLETQEGKYLPVEHCIKGTKGWEIQKDIYPLLPKNHIFDKPTFGSLDLAEAISARKEEENIEIELIGLCTDICVVSNALLLKAYMPEVKISVDPACCAGVTPSKHKAALETMKSCQIQGIQ